VTYAEKLLAEISNSVIYKDNFRPVTLKVRKSDLDEVNTSSGGDGSAEMMVVKMMKIGDDDNDVDEYVGLISGIHIASRILIIEPTRCTNFSNLFRNVPVHVSDSSSVHHQEFFTVHSAVVYVIHFCRQLASRIRSSILILLASCLQNCMTYTYCCVYSETLLMMDRGTV
jgi:hypothetical protein